LALLELLQQNTGLYVLAVLLLGLSVGSFLNVVIYRLPKILDRQWTRDCHEHLGHPVEPPAAPFNLNQPPSHCPACQHRIRPWENIPVVSWLLLRGRCSKCQTPISARYPMIEAVTALLSVIVALHFGLSWAMGGALLLTWALIVLSMIDFDLQLLPDTITLPFLWLGLLLSLGNVHADPRSAIIGAVAGYLSLWIVYQLFKRLTGKEGMGYGDFKLLAMLGAWLGWQYLPQIILLSALVGAVVGVSLILLRGRDRNIPIPFGPYLAAAGWISLMWGEEINQAYLRLSGLM
jgi:leader peptidase (prepilin peptidase)/N-methyltransferase